MITNSEEIFSFHLFDVPLFQTPFFLLNPLSSKKVPGLIYSENFLSMNLDEPVISTSRFNFSSVAVLAWWNNEQVLTDFSERSGTQFFSQGWHVRLKLYSRWGRINEISGAFVNSSLHDPNGPVVAITLARLKLSQTLRFIKWGKPVEHQVKNHQGKSLALAAFRPFNTFSTFSIWRNETEMRNMVHGNNSHEAGQNHKRAMQERNRKDFHYEFTTMRFKPIHEQGLWRGQSNLTRFV